MRWLFQQLIAVGLVLNRATEEVLTSSSNLHLRSEGSSTNICTSVQRLLVGCGEPPIWNIRLLRCMITVMRVELMDNAPVTSAAAAAVAVAAGRLAQLSDTADRCGVALGGLPPARNRKSGCCCCYCSSLRRGI